MAKRIGPKTGAFVEQMAAEGRSKWAQVRKTADVILKSQEFKRVAQAARIFDRTSMTDSDGNDFRVSRGHILTLGMMIESARLPEAIAAMKADPKNGYKNFLKTIANEDERKAVNQMLHGYLYDPKTKKMTLDRRQGFQIDEHAWWGRRVETEWQFTPEQLVQQVKSKMDDSLRAMVPHVLGYYNAVGKPALDEYNRIQGVNLPMIPMYVPQVRIRERRGEKLAMSEDEQQYLVDNQGTVMHPGGVEHYRADVGIEANGNLSNKALVNERTFSNSPFLILATPDLMIRHADDSARYTGWKHVATRLENVLGSGPNATAIRQKHGPDFDEVLQRGIKSISGQTDRPTGLEATLNALLGRAARYMMTNPRVIAYQGLSASQFIPYFGGRAIASALRQKATREGNRIADLVRNSQSGAQLWIRFNDANVERTYVDESGFANRWMAHTGTGPTGRFSGPRHVIQQVANFASRAMARSDKWAIDIGAIAAFNKAKAANPTLTDEQVAEIAAKELTPMVDASQTGTNPLYMTDIRRSNHWAQKIFGFLSGGTSIVWNQFEGAMLDLRNAANPSQRMAASRKVASTITGIAIQAALIAVLKTALSGKPKGKDDDGEDDDEETLNRELTYNMMESLVSSLPGGQNYSAETMTVLATALDHPDMRRRFGFLSGQTPDSAPFRWLTKAAQGLNQMLRSYSTEDMTDEEREKLREYAENNLVRAAKEGADMALGINLFGTARLAQGVYDARLKAVYEKLTGK
jgi:hypothetical protein